MAPKKIPVLGVAAASGTGKTTLLTKVIPLLRDMGWRIGLIKHSHHNFEIDQPGKDSFELRRAGAGSVLLVSKYRQALINEQDGLTEPALAEQVQILAQTCPDLILVEGFKHESFPKIELHRSLLGKPLLYPTDASIIAVASDTVLNLPEPVRLLDINQPEAVALFIKEFIESYD